MPTTVGEGILGSCTAEPLKCICVKGSKDRKGRERERGTKEGKEWIVTGMYPQVYRTHNNITPEGPVQEKEDRVADRGLSVR
jgi:hypothetical protein